MVANFGAGSTDAPELQTSQTAKQGVVSESPLLQGAADLFDKVGGLVRASRQSKQQKVVSDFTARQILVADALDQGRLRSSAHAQTLLRKNLLDAYEQHPELLGDFVKAQSEITKVAGAGRILVDGTEEEQRTREVNDQLVSSGLASPTATEDEFRVARRNAELAAQSKQRYDTAMDTINMEKATLELNSARRKELETQQKDLANKFVSENATVEFERVRNKYREILEGEGTGADKEAAIREFYTQWQAETASVIGDVESDMQSALKTTFDRLEQDYIDRATGALSLGDLERRNKQTLESAKALALADPVIANLAVTSGLLGSQGLAEVVIKSDPAVINRFLEFVAGANSASSKDRPSILSDDNVTRKAVEQYLPLVSSQMLSSDEVVKEAATREMVAQFEELEDEAGKIARDPARAIQLVDWLASPSFLKARNSNPDAFQNLDAVTSILDQHYHDEVSGMIRREFSQNEVFIGAGSLREGGELERTPTTEVVEAVPTSGGMTFKAIDPNDSRAVAKAANLNKKLKPIINNSVRAQAHLSGRTDYQQIWEEASELVLGTPSQPGGGDGDDLQLSNFQAIQEEKESVGAPIGNVSDAGAGFTVITREDGTSERREGTRAWRNNNPGNIEFGEFARSKGAVGSDGRFAVFPTYEAGRQAKEDLLFNTSSYRNKSITTAIQRYAPEFENNTGAYAKAIADALGIPLDTPLQSLSPEQRKAMLDVMERVEGFKEGKVIAQ